jgi:lactose/L-arabinose transport system substrate-binding protein
MENITMSFEKNNIVRSLAFGVVVAACSMPVMAKKNELTVWAWDPNFNVAIMEQAKAVYQKDHPDVSIKVEDFAKADVEQKMHTMLASGMTKSLPDIVLVEDYNARKFLSSYPGAFAAMDGKVDYKQFAPYKVELMTLNGKTYGVPFDTGVTGMYYRKDLLAQAGFTEKDMKDITWDRFIEIGKAVKAKTGKAMLGNDPNDPGMIRVMMQSAGSWYFDEKGALNIKNNEALKEALRIEKSMTDAGIVRPTMGWSEWVGAVNHGDVATITTGVWITASVKAGTDQAGKWAVAPTPRLNIKGGTNQSNIGGSSWYVLSSSDNSEQAIDFLNSTFGRNNDFYQKILIDRGAVGSYLPARTGNAYQQPDAFFGGQKIYSDFATWLTKVPKVNYGVYTYEADAALAAQLPAYFQGMPLEQVLEQIDSQLAAQIQ